MEAQFNKFYKILNLKNEVFSAITKYKLPQHKIERVMSNYKEESMSKKNVLLFKLLDLYRENPEKCKEVIKDLGDNFFAKIEKDWEYNARKVQLPPKDFDFWLLCGGRSSGKSKAAIEYFAHQMHSVPGSVFAVIAQDDGSSLSNCADKIRDVLIDRYGYEFGQMSSDGIGTSYKQREGEITLLNGSKLYTFTSKGIADKIRGKNLDGLWLDEFCFYNDPAEIMKQVRFAVRKGDARIVVTTTPKGAGTKVLRGLLNTPELTVVLAQTSAYDNLEHLSAKYVYTLLQQEGSRIAEEEVWADLLTDDGGKFKEEYIHRVDINNNIINGLSEIVIGYDTAVSSKSKSNLYGIIVAGKEEYLDSIKGWMNRYYIIEDGSDIFSPETGAALVSRLYTKYNCKKVVVETNQGGDYIAAILRRHNANLRIEEVRTQTNKLTRFDNILDLYEREMVYHNLKLGELEDQLLNLNAILLKKGSSPDRVDALVWALSVLAKRNMSKVQMKSITPFWC